MVVAAATRAATATAAMAASVAGVTAHLANLSADGVASASGRDGLLDWRHSQAAAAAAAAANNTTGGVDTSAAAVGNRGDPCALLDAELGGDEGLEQFTFVLNNVVLTAIVALGFVGNCITAVVLTRRSMTTSTNCFLLALAIADTVLLVCTFFLICLKSPDAFPAYYRHARPYVEPIAYPIGLTSQTCVIWLTVSFTVERYIAVCHPLRAARMCTLRRARIVVAAVVGLSCAYNATRWFEARTVEAPEGACGADDGQRRAYVDLTELGRDAVYRRAYFFGLYLPFMCLVPVAFLATLNALLVAAVRRSAQRRREVMNVREAKENNVTIMLVSVVVVFLVCQLPALVYNVAFGVDMAATGRGFYRYLNHLRNFAVTLNSAVNFILYCALGQQFRKTLVQTFAALARSSKRLALGRRSTGGDGGGYCSGAHHGASTSEFTTLQKTSWSEPWHLPPPPVTMRGSPARYFAGKRLEMGSAGISGSPRSCCRDASASEDSVSGGCYGRHEPHGSDEAPARGAEVYTFARQ